MPNDLKLYGQQRSIAAMGVRSKVGLYLCRVNVDYCKRIKVAGSPIRLKPKVAILFVIGTLKSLHTIREAIGELIAS